jgi:hypothetical protein
MGVLAIDRTPNIRAFAGLSGDWGPAETQMRRIRAIAF